MNRRERWAATQTSEATSDNTAVTPDALYRAGLVHLRAGRRPEAQVCCEQALATDPNHADTLHLMGLVCLYAEHPDLAIEWFVRAIRQDPQPGYLSILGKTLWRRRRFEEALATFDKAIQLKSDDATLWVDLGKVLVDLDRTDEALRGFQRALELDPRNLEAADRI